MTQLELNTFNDLYDTFVKAHSPDETIIHCDQRSLTLNDLTTMSDRYVYHLCALGVKPGTCVGYTMPNCPEILALIIALSRMGACAAPVFHMVPDMAKAGIFKNSRTTFVVTTALQATSLKECAVKTGAEFQIITIDANNLNDASLHGQPTINGKQLAEILPAKIPLNAGSYYIKFWNNRDSKDCDVEPVKCCGTP